MANTTNFGWETPDDTDLVKDGASAMRTLGNAIDTSLVDLKGGTTGQVLSKASNTDMDFTWVAQDDSNAIQNALLTTTGDTIYASSASTPARLGIGSTGQVLTVSGGVPAWTTISSGGMTSIASGSLSGTSTTISSISSSYKNLYLIVKDVTFSASTSLSFRLNGDSGTNYFFFYNGVGGTTFTRTPNETKVNYLIPENPNGDSFGSLTINDYANATTNKQGSYLGSRGGTETSNPGWFAYNSTTAISSITLLSLNGTSTFTAGTYTLYGVN